MLLMMLLFNSIHDDDYRRDLEACDLFFFFSFWICLCVGCFFLESYMSCVVFACSFVFFLVPKSSTKNVFTSDICSRFVLWRPLCCWEEIF